MLEEENKQLRMDIEKLKGIIYDERTFNEVNKKENERLRKENEELKEEFKKWKKEWYSQTIEANDEGFSRVILTQENERLKKENEEIRETLTRARFRLEEENQILRLKNEKQNKENTKLKMEKLLLKTVMKKMKLCGICKNYEQEDCECSLCGEIVNNWETCEKWEFLGIEEDEK